MGEPSIRVLVVDDYEPWRRFACRMLRKQQELEVIGEVSDGLEAVQRAQELKPDLILLDIGLPNLHGIEAARRIREVSPASKILFVSEQTSPDIAQEALNTCARGYVIKSNAASELLPAVQAVLAGKRFISTSLSRQDSSLHMNDQDAITHSHEVAFYADDSSVVHGYARFIETFLKAGDTVIVVLTESHRANLLPKLAADGVNVPEVIEQGRYIPLDAAATLSRLTVNGMPDPVRCVKVIGDFIMAAAEGKGEHARIAVCGETAPTLLSKGNAEGAIELEHIWNAIARDYGVHIFCGYLSSAFLHQESESVFQRICAEHSAIRGRGPGH